MIERDGKTLRVSGPITMTSAPAVRDRGLVLLGSGCESRVALDQLECPRVIRTLATGAMLLDPLLKKQAWPELRSQFLRA